MLHEYMIHEPTKLHNILQICCHFKTWQHSAAILSLLHMESLLLVQAHNMHSSKQSKQPMPPLAAAAAVATSRWSYRNPVRISQRPPVEIWRGQQLFHGFVCLLSGECFVFLVWEFLSIWSSMVGRIVAVPWSTLWQFLHRAWKSRVTSCSLIYKNINLDHHKNTTKRNDKPARGEFFLRVRLRWPWSLPYPSW